MARSRKKLSTAAVLTEDIDSLRQEDQTWEVDFRALPKPLMQSETQYLGVVVRKDDGSLLAQSQIDGRARTDDLSALLIAAMRRPLTGKAHRPSRLLVRGHRQWQELFSPLEELGIEVSVRRELPKVKAAYDRHLKQLREARRMAMAKPSKQQSAVESLFPAIAEWVVSWGHIEIGDQEGFGFTVRAIDYGGVVFEDDRARTLAEAMAALEKGLGAWFGQEGIELE